MLNINNEIWKPIPGFEGIYEVSNLGSIRNTRGKVMSTYKINSGYLCLKFTVNNKRTSHLVHRLVLSTFEPNEFQDNLEVNHLDENKSNNALSNLQWVTSSGNKQHSIQSGAYAKIFEMKNSLGKKHLPNPHSRYHNVTYDVQRQKWAACIRVNGKNMHRKRFNTEEEAALHVNWIIDTLGLTNRPKNIIY